MQDIQNKAIKTYLENIEFLKYNHQSLYERVSMLSTAIDNNQYKERYHLEYIKEDQEFDIFDSSNETYLYNRNPKKFIDDAVSNSNLDKVNSIDLLDPEVYNLQQPFEIDDSLTIEFKTIAKVQNDIFDFIKIFKKSTVYKNKKFKKLDKFIIAGTLLGRHIEPIVKKLKTKLLYVYENNLEIFRLSLFTTNYSELSYKNNLVIIFSIMEDSNKVDMDLERFFQYEVYSNYMLKYYSSNYNIGNIFDKILAVFAKNNPLSFNYCKMIDGLITPVCKNISKYPVLNTKSEHNLLKDIPVLFIAAGPSFGKNIDWIRQHQSKYFIIAVGAVVVKLIENDISPDMIISADSDEVILNQFPGKIRSKIKDIPFLASSSTYTKLLDIFPYKNIILYELMLLVKNTSQEIKGHTVGEVSLRLMTILGANHIYLLGTDMALDQDTGASHISDHAEVNIQDITEDKKEENYFIKNNDFNIAGGSIVVKGNFKESVVTTTRMISSIHAYNYNMHIIKANNPNIKVYNLNDGAFFEGIEPLEIKNILIPKNDKTDKNTIKYLTEHSKLELESNDIELIRNSIITVNTLINNVNKLRKSKVKTYEKFHQERVKIVKLLLVDLKIYSNLYLYQLFTRYYLTMEAFLGFQFNEKISDEANLIKKVKNTWCEHILKLADLYKSNMTTLDIS